MTDRLLPFERSFLRWLLENGMSWERIDLDSHRSDAGTTGYRFLPAQPPRCAVVALHGAGNDALFAWIGLFKRLLRDRCAIMTFDLPGHGRLNRGTFSVERSAELFSRVVGIAARQSPGGRVVAIGVSLGGSLMLHALSRREAGVARAAAIVAPLRIRLSARNVLPELGPATFRLLWREREHYGLTGLVPSFGPFKRDIYPLRLTHTSAGAFGYVETLNELLEDLDLERRSAEITIPVLLVYGTADRIVPLEQGERLARSIPNVRLETIAGGTHLTTPLRPEAVHSICRWVVSTS